MTIINFEELENGIKKIEESLLEYNIEERELILKNVLVRITIERQKTRQSQIVDDTINKISFKNIINKIMKGEKE